MAGTPEGALKTAAARAGLSLDEYIFRREFGLKRCMRCKEWKPLRAFSIDRSRADGRDASCAVCRRPSTGGPSRAERRVRRTQGLAWCRKCCAWTEVAKGAHAGLCADHVREDARRRYATDPAFRFRRLEHVRCRKHALEPMPPVAAVVLREEFDGRCAYCPAPAETYDHIVPIVKGGRSTPGNVVPACRSCNSSKKDRDLDTWLAATRRAPHPALWDRIALADCGLYG